MIIPAFPNNCFLTTINVENYYEAKKSRFNVLTTFLSGYPFHDATWNQISFTYSLFDDHLDNYIIKPIAKRLVINAKLVKKDYHPKFYFD